MQKEVPQYWKHTNLLNLNYNIQNQDLLQRKRHVVVKTIRVKTLNKKEIISSSLSHLHFDIHILKELNEIMPKAVKEMQELERQKLKDEVKGLTKNDKKEYNRYVSWRKKVSVEKQRRFSTASIKVRDIVSNSVMLYIKFHRFELFIKEMSLVYLITSFEEFLERLINNIYSIKPIILRDSSKQISYKEIIDSKNIEELHDKMIKHEIKSLMKKQIDEINKSLKSDFKLDLSKNTDWVRFKERFYRRHILIHNNLRPDQQYRDLTGYRGKSTRLVVTDVYLKRSYSLFNRYATQITNYMISKFS